MAGSGADDERPEPPLSQKRPARPAVADEINHIHPRLRELRKIDVANAPQQRVVVRLDDKLHRRRQAIEGEVGVDLPELLEIMAKSVDLEDPHRELRNVFHSQIEGHRCIGPERGQIRGEKLDVDPVAEGPVGRRAEDCRMALLRAAAAGQLRLGKQPGEIIPFDQWDKLPRVGGVSEEVGQERADERLVVADRRQERTFEPEPELAGEGAGQIGRQEPGGHVALRPGQLQILEKRSLVPLSLRQVVREEVVADMGLERVVNRPEPIGKRLQALEVGALDAGVAAPVIIGPRLELLEHRRHEGRMLNELGLENAERVELGDGEEPMDRQRPEAAGVWRVEISGNQLFEAVVIGADKPRQELPATEGIERGGFLAEPVEGRVFVAVERAWGMGLRPGGKRLDRHKRRIERRRQLRLGAGDDSLVRIRDAEPTLEIGNRRLRVFRVGEQRPPRADLPHPRCLAMGLHPLGKDWLDLGIPLRVEPMERLEIKRLFRPWHEPRKHRLAVLGERKLLHEADLTGPATRTPKGDKDRHHRPGYASPAAEARDGRGARGAPEARKHHENPFCRRPG